MKYKLIKTYPGSGALGDIVEQSDLTNYPEYYRRMISLSTYEGGHIFEGDTYYTVFFQNAGSLPLYKINGPYIMNEIGDPVAWSTKCEYFKTVTAAMDYSKRYVKVFSLDDVEKVFETATNTYEMIKRLRGLASNSHAETKFI